MTDPILLIWTADPPPKEVRAALERLTRMDDVVAVAAMPDVHLASEVCVGAVVASRRRLFPEAVGGDIGCGMAAVRFHCEAARLRSRDVAARLFDLLGQRIPSTAHRSGEAILPLDLAGTQLSSASLEKKKSSIGRVQFGTLGRGNHFVEFQKAENDELWLMLHSGSRGMGQAIRDHHSAHASRHPGGLCFLDADSTAGIAYLDDLSWALNYAQENRRRMVDATIDCVAEVLDVSADMTSYIDCHHNFVRQELHFGAEVWVHRKGAISAAEGEPGIIPGSMGSPSFHVAGRGLAESLCSSSHGAGRVMSRSDARRKVTVTALVERMRGIWFDNRLAHRLRDEAPQAYKDIGAVMRAQRDLTRIVRKLEPVLVYKGT